MHVVVEDDGPGVEPVFAREDLHALLHDPREGDGPGVGVRPRDHPRSRWRHSRGRRAGRRSAVLLRSAGGGGRFCMSSDPARLPTPTAVTSCLLTDPACLGHVCGPGHPESPQRLRRIIDDLEARPIPGATWAKARPATVAELTAVHSLAHVEPAGGPRRPHGSARSGHRHVTGQLARDGRRRRSRGRRGRGGVGRAGAERVRPGAATRTPCRSHARHGLLPDQQRGGRSRGRPPPRGAARGDPRLGCPPRQRHPAPVRRSGRCPVPVLASVPLLSGNGRAR